MNQLPFKNLFTFAVCLLALLACQSTPYGIKTTSAPDFDLDILYAEQSIIGTTPKKPIWSADGRQVAFLWNDEGYTYRDVWSYSVQTGQKQQLTHLVDAVELERKVAGGHIGISEVVWLDSLQSQIAFILDGKLFVQADNNSPQQISTEQKYISQLSLSPDNKKLAFVSDGSLWLQSSDLTSPDSAQLLIKKTSSDAYVSSYQWSHDSQKIIFQITDNSPLPKRDIHYYADSQLHKKRVSRAFPGDATAEYSLGLVTVNSRDTTYFERPSAVDYIWNYGLSTDGESVFINSSDLLVKHHTIYVFDTHSGNREVFYYEHDPKHLRPDWQEAWAPEDDGLIILTDKGGFLHLYHQKTKQSKPRALTSGEWEIASFEVNHSNNQIYFTANKPQVAERQIYSVSMTGGDVNRISPAAAGTHTISLATAQPFVASLFSSDAQPLELYVLNLNNKEATQVTHSPLPSFNDYTWADISYIKFPSHLDGTSLVGRLSLPANHQPTKKYPLIVGSVYSDSVRNQYGGRTSHPTWGLDQYLVAQGYIVLNVNVRGSWGQGRTHNQGLRYGYGVIDIEDLHSGVKHLVDVGYVDPERVGIWGSSYGGLMTMMSLFKKPGVYAAGIAGAPATNVAHAYPGQMWVMGEPTGEDQPQRYQQQSPLYHTDGLEDSLMIIHGSKDPVVLYSDTITVIEKLIAKQKLFELVTLPGTSHGWDAEGNDVRLFTFKKMVAFFDQYLK